jgi:hypothetical protein
MEYIDTTNKELERSMENKLSIRATFTKAQTLAEKGLQPQQLSTLEEMIPRQYHEYIPVFDKKTSERLPQRSSWDHAVELKEEFKP